MTPRSRPFARSLGRLDSGATVEFVADLWRVRGWEVTVDGHRLLANRTHPGETLLILVLARRRDPWLLSGGRDVDVVVDARGTRRGRRLAASCGARYLGPDDVLELMRHGLRRSEADRLSRAHLGQPLESLVDRPSGDRSPLLVSLALVVVLVSGLAIASVSLHGDGTDADADAVATPLATPPEPAFPPGVDEEGVVSPERLADAHRDELDGRSYRWVVVLRQSPVDGDGTESELRRTVVVENETAFRRNRDGVVDVLDAAGSRDSLGNLDASIYADGEHVYWRTVRGDAPVYERTDVGDLAAGTELFALQAERYLVRYLSTDRTDVVGDERGDAHRLVVRGTPERLASDVSNFSAVASVDRNGFVSSLRASYVVESGDTAHRVEFSFRYTALDRAEASPPEWYRDARSATAPSDSTAARTGRSTAAQTERSTNETTSASSSRATP